MTTDEQTKREIESGSHLVRIDSFGDLDEFFARGVHVHLERMDRNEWWIGITLPDGRIIHLRFGAINPRAAFYLRVQEDWQDGAEYTAMYKCEAD